MTPPSFFLSCSGPGAVAVIHANNEIADGCAFIGGVLTLLLLWEWGLRRSRPLARPLAGAVPLMLLHPAWMMHGGGGDCGYLKRDVSYAITVILVALVVWQQVLARRERSESASRDRPI